MLSVREVCYHLLTLVARSRWEELRDILSQRSHPWTKLLNNAENELFLELTLILSHIALGEKKHARARLERILQFDSEEGRAQLLQAYLDLMDNNTEEAIPRYTALLHHAQLRGHVKRILNVLKKTNSPYKLTLEKPWTFFYRHYQRSWKDFFYVFFKKWQRGASYCWKRQGWFGKLGLASLFVVVMSLFLSPVRMALSGGGGEIFFQIKEKLYAWGLPFDRGVTKTINDASLETLALEEEKPRPSRVESAREGTAYFKALFSEIKAAIYAKDVNQAIILHNQVLGSQAPLDILEKFDILMTFTSLPHITSFKNTLSFAVITKKQKLYNGTYWKYKGVVSAPRKLGIEEFSSRDFAKNSFLRTDNRWLYTFIIHENDKRRELVEIFIGDRIGLVREGESYEVLMQFTGIVARGRPYMQGLAMNRLQ